MKKRAPSLILDVNGVGYEVFIPMTIYKELPELNQETTIKTKVIYKEDSQTIYGFKTYEEKDLFELLISISGIGSKTVLKFLNQYTAKDIKEWIVSEDLKALTQLPRIRKQNS